MSGSGPDDLNEEPDINANPPIDLPTSQGFEKVSSHLEKKGKELEGIQKIDLQIWLWLLCWASFYNGLENIFHVCERSELKWNN